MKRWSRRPTWSAAKAAARERWSSVAIPASEVRHLVKDGVPQHGFDAPPVTTIEHKHKRTHALPHEIRSLEWRADEAMKQWKQTLSPRVRASIDEPSRRERVTREIQEERSRRTVRMTVAAAPGHSATTGLDHSASADRKAEARSTAGISPAASSRQLDGREQPPTAQHLRRHLGNMTESAPGKAVHVEASSDGSPN
jgi:hypothetical protein